jgi:hypothetical protein
VMIEFKNRISLRITEDRRSIWRRSGRSPDRSRASPT